MAARTAAAPGILAWQRCRHLILLAVLIRPVLPAMEVIDAAAARERLGREQIQRFLANNPAGIEWDGMAPLGGSGYQLKEQTVPGPHGDQIHLIVMHGTRKIARVQRTDRFLDILFNTSAGTGACGFRRLADITSFSSYAGAGTTCTCLQFPDGLHQMSIRTDSSYQSWLIGEDFIWPMSIGLVRAVEQAYEDLFHELIP
ncbi:MAG: hypothetical protein ACOCXA_01285 [Planctomycetota bacterium]